MQIYSIQMWLDNSCLSASWGEPWVGIHLCELWPVGVRNRPTQDGMGGLQALGKDSVSSRSYSASVLTSFLQFGKWHFSLKATTAWAVCGGGGPLLCGRQDFGKIAWYFHQFFSPLSQFFSLTSTYTWMQSFCLQNRPGALIFGLSGHSSIPSGATNHKQEWVAVFVLIPLPSHVWTLLSLAVLGLATHTTSCKLVAGLTALPSTWHQAWAEADSACQSQPRTPPPSQPRKCTACLWQVVNEGRESGKAQWTILNRSGVYGTKLLIPSFDPCVAWCVSLDTCQISAENITSDLTFNQSAERLQSWDVPELTQKMGSDEVNWPWVISTENPYNLTVSKWTA